MKIVGSLLMSLVGALAAAGVAVVGCSTTNNLNSGGGTSGPGETCTRTFDCKEGLVCLQNICLQGPSMAVPDSGTMTTGDSGTGMVMGPHLGLLNESCQVSGDCQSPLECLAQKCSVVSWQLTATGKTCSGECTSAADCCEVPVNFDPFLSGWYTQNDAGVYDPHPGLTSTNVRCEDLLTFLGGDATICANPANFNVNTSSLAQGCFDYNTYCGSCGANGPWACTNNQCVYTAPCTPTGTVASQVTACPSETRTGRGLSSTCTVPAGATMGSCQAGCAMDSDCAGKIPPGSNHTCSAADAGAGTNCTCYQSACYFKCSHDLDCAVGNTCDGTTHLCAPAGCTADADCIQSLGNPRASCAMATHTCQIACDNDSNCGPPSSICSPTATGSTAGFCKPAGCTSDTDCPGTGLSAKQFCVMATPTMYTGAITN